MITFCLATPSPCREEGWDEGRNRTHRTRKVAGFLLALLAVGGREPARAGPAELAKAVPNVVVAAYFVGGSVPRSGDLGHPTESGDQNSFQIATFLIDRAFEVGLLSRLDETTRAWLDALASVSVVVEHPHAVMLLDISAEKTDEDGHRLSGLHAALVMHTRGRNELIERRIQHLLGSYTNRDETTLETIEREGTTTYRLRDRRLADWVVLSWGRLGDDFVVAIGDGSFERVAATLQNPSSSVATDRWFVDGLNRLAAEDALLTVYLRCDELRRTSGPALAMKIDRVLQALKIAGGERVLWAVGYAGRSVEIRQLLKTAASDEVSTIAGAGVLDASNAPRVPDSATAFAAVDVKPSVWFDRARNAYLAGRSPTNQAGSRAYWRDIETRAGIRFADDIFAGLSGPIIVHDFPKHALRLPPAWTIVAPISGDADRLRRSLDALFTTWQRELEEKCSMRLRRDDDGVWHLFVGVEGPALMVTDRYLVISFAPPAVRQNVELLVRPAASAAPK
jgi:hypothetical protein